MKGQRRMSLALALGLHAVAVASLIKRVVRAYRYSRTGLGRSAIAAGCRLTEQTIVPALACKVCSDDFLKTRFIYGQNDPSLST